MTKGHTETVKVHYQGNEDDFIVIASSIEGVEKYKEDKTIPLIDVVDSFDVFVTHKHGAQGQLDRASKSKLENEFGTSVEDDVVKAILEKGSVQATKGAPRQGDTNTLNGPGAGASNLRG